MLIKNSPRPRHEPRVRHQCLHGIATSVPEALSPHRFHAAQARHLKAGERLFAIGDPGDGCFLLEQGLLKATVASHLGEERIIAILGPGAIVGELSMIDGLPRSASVVAMQDCVLRFVSREALQQRANTKSETYQLTTSLTWMPTCPTRPR